MSTVDQQQLLVSDFHSRIRLVSDEEAALVTAAEARDLKQQTGQLEQLTRVAAQLINEQEDLVNEVVDGVDDTAGIVSDANGALAKACKSKTRGGTWKTGLIGAGAGAAAGAVIGIATAGIGLVPAMAIGAAVGVGGGAAAGKGVNAAADGLAGVNDGTAQERTAVARERLAATRETVQYRPRVVEDMGGDQASALARARAAQRRRELLGALGEEPACHPGSPPLSNVPDEDEDDVIAADLRQAVINMGRAREMSMAATTALSQQGAKLAAAADTVDALLADLDRSGKLLLRLERNTVLYVLSELITTPATACMKIISWLKGGGASSGSTAARAAGLPVEEARVGTGWIYKWRDEAEALDGFVVLQRWGKGFANSPRVVAVSPRNPDKVLPLMKVDGKDAASGAAALRSVAKTVVSLFPGAAYGAVYDVLRHLPVASASAVASADAKGRGFAPAASASAVAAPHTPGSGFGVGPRGVGDVHGVAAGARPGGPSFAAANASAVAGGTRAGGALGGSVVDAGGAGAAAAADPQHRPGPRRTAAALPKPIGSGLADLGDYGPGAQQQLLRNAREQRHEQLLDQLSNDAQFLRPMAATVRDELVRQDEDISRIDEGTRTATATLKSHQRRMGRVGS